VSNLFCDIQNIYIFAPMKQINHGSLFSGIGGFDLAAEWMGWNNVFHCEWMPFPRQILKYHFPNSISYEDITKTDFTIHRGTIDVLTGGFPCQPYSVAGKRLGKEDERHLWPEMLRAIREIEPRFVLGENVRGLLSWNGGMVFDEVQADLEDAGYEVIPFIIPACAVGAPHRRDRVWFIAKNTLRDGCLFGQPIKVGTNTWEQWNFGTRSGFGVCLPKGFVAHTNHTRGGSRLGEVSEWNNHAEPCDAGGGITSNSKDERQRGLREQGEKTRTRESNQSSGSVCGISHATDAHSGRQSGQEHGKEKPGQLAKESVSNYWQNFPTQPPICGGDDGLLTELDGITFSKWRNESIKGYGNAVVPQVVYQIFKAIQHSAQ
jgi:DNA (cytosine-5)-methyltransferase 1